MKYFFLLLSFLPLCLYAQNSSERLHLEIEKLKKDPDLKHATWGLCVISISSGQIVAEYNSSIGLIPASTLKIVTTGAVLGILDTSYRYETRLEHDGFIDTTTGTLRGNLHIKGSGDPTLESEYFKNRKGIIYAWTKAIKQRGIKIIEGAIVADASVFDDELIPPTWIWSDMGNYYGSGTCGLNFSDNKYTLYFKSGPKNGDSTTITRIAPEIPGLQLSNYVRSGGNDDEAFVYGSPYSYNRYVKGTIPAGKSNYEVEGSVPDPAWLCAYSLEQELKKEGIKITLPPTTSKELKMNHGNRILLYNSFSPTLDSIVHFTNIKSNNLYAESLLKSLALNLPGQVEKTKPGTEAAGIEMVKKYWASKKVDVQGLYMSDGCGLSRMNTITAKQQAEILRVIAGEPYFKLFYKSLPIAGRTGSLAAMCKNTCAENNLRAKSGYINKVRGYTGYVKNKSGEDLSFSILANNYDCSPDEIKKKIERLLVLIAELD